MTRRRAPPVTHTHALFAEQSQSILDNPMEIIAPELSMQWLRRGARSVLVPNLSRPSSAKWSILRPKRTCPDKEYLATVSWSNSEASLMRCAARSRSGRALSSRTQRSRPQAATSSRRHHQRNNIVEDNDVFGDGVNVAARLEGLAEPEIAYRRGRADL